MSKTRATGYKIEVRGSNETVAFAAQELQKYLQQTLGGAKIGLSAQGSPDQPGFLVTEAGDAGEIIDPATVREGRDLDQIFILSRGQQVILAGNNPRSVLFAVYDFLERLGFRWLHAGPDGEVLPHLDTVPLTDWQVTETASFRYRGVSVEGAYTPKHAIAFVDWMAKKKMNHFFMQFENGTFWYRRMVPDLKVSQAIQWDREIMAEVKKRGLMLEWYGHGWNHNAIGKHVVGLQKAYKVPEELRPLLAEVNGQRGWRNNYPLETQLCLTNPVVRKKVLRYVERVIRRNPHVDILGLWLADGYNNQCECENCRKHRMSEMYAEYTNEIAEIAHRLNPNLKVEILAYMSTLEAPQRVPIKNPHGNLILMLAPLFRCYRHRLHDPECVYEGEIPRFPVLNKQPRIRNWDFAQYFADWRKCYTGDTYLFDYHMLTLRYVRGGSIPEIASQDIKDLATHGFDGYVGCQTLRCFWPTGLDMKVIAETLWDVSKSYEEICEEHLREWFGEATAAGEALEGMYAATSGISPAHDEYPSPESLRESVKTLEQIGTDLRGVEQEQADPVIRRRLGFLADHADYLADQLRLDVLSKYISEEEREAANERLTYFFVQRAEDAEFLIDAQYHGKAFLERKPRRKLLGQQ